MSPLLWRILHPMQWGQARRYARFHCAPRTEAERTLIRRILDKPR
jgi:hypothetical protein